MKNYTTVIFVLYLLIFPIIFNILQINIFNCLNEKNKMFTNSFCHCLSLFFFLFSLTFSLYLNVRQLQRMSFIRNAFN
jgi:hypothetical protein